MGSSRAEEQRDDSAGTNSQVVDEAGKQKAGTSSVGEKQPPFVDPGDISGMGSSRAEEQKDDSTEINPQRVDEGEVGTNSAAADPGDVAAQNPASVQQHGAGKLPESKWFAVEDRWYCDPVFGVTEKDLEKHDERERLLAAKYRAAERERKDREMKAVEARARRGLATHIHERDVVHDDDDSCYIEIKNLVFIENSVIHKKALEEWDRKHHLFASRVESKSTELGTLKNEVFQLIFFSVFQGVVITATSQTNLLPCSSRWSTILMSVMASILIIAGVAYKLTQISSLEKNIFSERQALKDVVRRIQALRREGKDFVFAKFTGDIQVEESKQYHFLYYAVGIISFLLVFTVIFPISQWKILCYRGSAPPAT